MNLQAFSYIWKNIYVGVVWDYWNFFQTPFKEHNKLLFLFFFKKENNITKDARNPFRLKIEMDDTTNKDIRNIFKLKKINRWHCN